LESENNKTNESLTRDDIFFPDNFTTNTTPPPAESSSTIKKTADDSVVFECGSENQSPIKKDANMIDELAVTTASAAEEDHDFVLIEPNQIHESLINNHHLQKRQRLKPGHKWKRELIFKSKLAMHTSYDRKDNADAASVTAISISKDHRTVFVGDSRGRIFSWLCTAGQENMRQKDTQSSKVNLMMISDA
jgi:hypothetical protein